MMFGKYFLGCCLFAFTLLLLTVNDSAAQEPKDILWFGNSFTTATCCGSTRTVPDVFRDIAVAAGHPVPLNRNASSNGRSLQFHLDVKTRIINSGIVAGGEWEHVILQDASTWPTHIGNLTEHLSSSLGLYQAVAEHSPNVVPVLYETWARGYPHPFYAGTTPDFPGGPKQMQQELREGYQMAVENINTAAGTDIAKLAPAGDAWELADFPGNFYDANDSTHYHAQNRGTMLNALVLYGTIYDDPTTSDIDLSVVLASLSLEAADGQLLTGLADATLVPEPGTLMLVGAGALMLMVHRARNA